jgi:translation elongation factor EF-1alpha
MESPYERIGRIIHFYPKASVAIIELVSSARKGDRIIVRGSLTKLQQTIDSMEYEHAQISAAEPGQSVGIKIVGRVYKNDIVYRLKP